MQRYLFPGNSCFPISPCPANNKERNKGLNIIDKED